VCLVWLGACDSSPIDLTAGTPIMGSPALAADPIFSAPIPNPAKISSTFGPRWKSSANRYDFHPGIQYFDYLGTQASATGPGTHASGYPLSWANFAWTLGPVWKSGGNRHDFHPGIDYFDDLGTPVLAIGPGTVDAAYPVGSSTFPAGGNVVVVKHTLSAPRMFHGQLVDRIYAVYLHLDSFSVVEGDTVTAGQQIGAMGMTGDTEFVHLHFEIRVQTVCSLPYQIAHPDSTCALGFDPHVHPFLFVGGANDDQLTVTKLPTTSGTKVRIRATRGDLDLDVIQSDQGTIGFIERRGIDATSLDTLDNFEYGFLTLEPQPFSSTDSEIVYDLTFPDEIGFLEVRDIYGKGLRFGER